MTVFRASSFGRCDRALIAAGLGMEPASPPEAMLKAYERGQKMEWHVLTALASRKEKVKWRDTGKEVKLGYNILDPGLMTSYRKVGDGVGRVPHDGQFAVELGVGEDRSEEHTS